MLNLFETEKPGWQLHCGTAIAGSKTCRNTTCSNQCSSSLDDYCATCSSKRTSKKNPLKACGFQPIRLTSAAMAPVLSTVMASDR